ncbi:MAG: cytochrome-c peroxidase [Polyangiaceae bacterium]
MLLPACFERARVNVWLVGGALTACAPPVRVAPPSSLAASTPADAGPFGTASDASSDGGIFPGNPDGELALDPSAGTRFTQCINGLPVAIGSSTESGGISPDIPSLITHASKPVPPLSGGTLLALSDGTTVAVSDPERDQVYLVDTANGRVVTTLTLQAGDEPSRLAQDGAGRVHVVLRRAGALATIDPKSAQIIARTAVCSAPRGVAVRKETDEVYVACAGGELVSLPAAGGAATRGLLLDHDLRDVVVGADGSLLVSTFRNAEVLVIGPDGSVTERLRPGSGMVPAVTREPAFELRTPSVAWRLVPMDPGSNSVLMLHETGITSIVDTAPGGYAGISNCGGIVQTGLSLLRAGKPSPPVSTGLGSLTLAIDVAVSPDHQKVAFAVGGNSPAQGPNVVEETLASALPPVPSQCGTVAIANDISRPLPAGQVVAVGYSPSGVLYAQTREPATLWRSDTGGTVSLAADSRADTGHTIFHINSGAGVACASCHPEGGEDGRVWNFVCTGARRTQSVRGGISLTAPFHWDGSESNFSRLVDDVFSGRMAGPLLSDEQKNALQSWVDSVPALPKTADLDTPAVARGQALFLDASVGCSSCHSGSLLTNNQTVDVGTGSAFQVPSLLGVSWRAPYLHNGCAATLAERFSLPSCGGGDKHSVTSTLSAAQVGDLVTYLQAL